jgi:hypothetical protein
VRSGKNTGNHWHWRLDASKACLPGVPERIAALRRAGQLRFDAYERKRIRRLLQAGAQGAETTHRAAAERPRRQCCRQRVFARPIPTADIKLYSAFEACFAQEANDLSSLRHQTKNRHAPSSPLGAALSATDDDRRVFRK